MKLGESEQYNFAHTLKSQGIVLKVPPFVVHLRSDIDSLAGDLRLVYSDFFLGDKSDFCDFHLQILRESGVRRWIKPLARFYFDDRPSFVPLPTSQALTMFEWGLNWCVAAHCHQFLIIHAAVVEKRNKAVLIPAPPGSGKSTLCAALIQQGWRLLSDELALLEIDSMQVFGMARPVNLKNQSIEIIRRFEPSAVFSNVVPDTTKGTIALLKPPSESVQQVLKSAEPRWIIVPQYSPEAVAELTKLHKAETFMLLAEQAFNYDIHGTNGFEAVGRLIDQCETLQFRYSCLDDAVRVFDALAQG